MQTVPNSARTAHPHGTSSGDGWISPTLVPVAARLIATVRDEGPEAVAQVLSQVPAAGYGRLAVVLAAMVDPDRTVSELLAWTTTGPVRSLDWKPWSAREVECPDCGHVARNGNMARHRRTHRAAQAA